MKGKSLSLQIISFVITFGSGLIPTLPIEVAVWIGALTYLLTILVSQLASSGEWPKGWSKIMWITNISGIVIQFGQYLSDHMLVDPHVINYVFLGINAFLFSFIKDYGSGTAVGPTRITGRSSGI